MPTDYFFGSIDYTEQAMGDDRLQNIIQSLKSMEEVLSRRVVIEPPRNTVAYISHHSHPIEYEIARYVYEFIDPIIKDLHYVLTNATEILSVSELDDVCIKPYAENRLYDEGFPLCITSLTRKDHCEVRTVHIEIADFKLYLFALPELQDHLLIQDSRQPKLKWYQRLFSGTSHNPRIA